MKRYNTFLRLVCTVLVCILLMGSCAFMPVSTNDHPQTGSSASQPSADREPHMTDVLFEPGTLTEPFNFGHYYYNVDIPAENDFVSIIPVLEPGLTVNIESPEKLEYGKNIVKIHVLNQASEDTTYYFILNRLSSDNAFLSSLSIEGFKLDKAFDKSTFEYSAKVNSGTDSVNILYELDDATATYELIGGEALEYGDNLITVKVTSQSKTTTNEYNINVIRPDDRPKNPKYIEMVEQGKGKFIAITFDDGPSPYTNQLLDILKKHKVCATFYLVGNRVASYPDEVKRMANEGHAFGNHTWDHSYLNKLTDDEKREVLNKTDDAIRKLTDRETTTIRPPGGKWDRSIKSFDGKPIVFWSVDPLDWKYRDTETVANNIMNTTTSGSNILLHDLYLTSVEAADIVIGSLKEQGYTFVTVDELLRIKKYKARLDAEKQAAAKK